METLASLVKQEKGGNYKVLNERSGSPYGACPPLSAPPSSGAFSLPLSLSPKLQGPFFLPLYLVP